MLLNTSHKTKVVKRDKEIGGRMGTPCYLTQVT